MERRRVVSGMLAVGMLFGAHAAAQEPAAGDVEAPVDAEASEIVEPETDVSYGSVVQKTEHDMVLLEYDLDTEQEHEVRYLLGAEAQALPGIQQLRVGQDVEVEFTRQGDDRILVGFWIDEQPAEPPVGTDTTDS